METRGSGSLADWLSSFVDLVVNMAMTAAVAALAFCGVAIVAGVVARYVFRAPIPGIEEISSYSLLALVFLGLAHTRRAGRHVRIDFLTRHLQPGAWRLVEVSGLLLGTAYLLFLAWGALTIAISSYQIQAVSGTILRVPVFALWLLIPVGLAIMAGELIRYSVRRVMSKRGAMFGSGGQT